MGEKINESMGMQNLYFDGDAGKDSKKRSEI